MVKVKTLLLLLPIIVIIIYFFKLVFSLMLTKTKKRNELNILGFNYIGIII